MVAWQKERDPSMPTNAPHPHISFNTPPTWPQFADWEVEARRGESRAHDAPASSLRVLGPGLLPGTPQGLWAIH